jgi:HEAT repeat protein
MNTDQHRLRRSATKSTIHLCSSVFICGFFLVTACQKPNEQVWSTKSDSMLGASTDLSAPTLTVTPRDGAEVLLEDRRRAAIDLLVQASESSNPLLRAHAIEALSLAPNHIENVARRALADENRGVRFAAAMTVGRLKLTTIAPLVQPLLHDESPSVQAAAIYALRRCGNPINPTPLSGMLLGDDPEIKANAAFVLGEMGEKSAVDLLRYSVGKGLHGVPSAKAKIIELQIAEAMVKLGSRRQLDVIHAALYAPTEEAEIAALACQMCARLRDASAAPDLSNLMRNDTQSGPPAEVRMAAAMALAQIDPTRARDPQRRPTAVDVTLQYIHSADYRLRAQAATTLGVIGDTSTLPQLTRLMSDENSIVQVAAAGAVLRFPLSERVSG